MNRDKKISQFLASPAFGVAGASLDRRKYGNKVLRCLQQNNRSAIPINPRETAIEGVACVSSVDQLPAKVNSISIITPPAVTETIVIQAIAHGIRNIWMQPGAESPAAVEYCLLHETNVIADGSCILVVLGYREP